MADVIEIYDIIIDDTIVLPFRVGVDGATFTPAVTDVSGDITLSWTNDREKTNPTPVILNEGVPEATSAAIQATNAANAATKNTNAAIASANSAASSANSAASSANSAAETANTKAGEAETAAQAANQAVINMASEFAKKVSLTGNETIAGVKTYSDSPIVPAPTTDLQVAHKKYVDDADALKSNITDIHNTEEVTAVSLVNLRKEVDALKTLINDAVRTYAQIETLSVRTLHLNGAPLFIFGTAAPAVVPDFVGQIFIKTTATTAVWIATGDSATENWKEV